MKSPGLCYGNERRMVPREQKFSATKTATAGHPLGKSLVLLLRVAVCPRGPSVTRTHYGRAPNEGGPIICSQLVNPFDQPGPASINPAVVGGGDFFHSRPNAAAAAATDSRKEPIRERRHAHIHTLIFYEIELNFPLDCGEK